MCSIIRETNFKMKKSLTILGLSLLFSAPIFAQDIFSAISDNDAAGVRYLICQKGANLNARVKDGATPLIDAVKGGQYGIVRMIIQKDVNVNAQDKAGNTALIIACQSAPANSKIINLLLHQSPELNTKNKAGVTALIAAVNANNTDAVKLLLENGANKDAKDKQKKTAVYYAQAANNTNMLALLNSPAMAEQKTAN